MNPKTQHDPKAMNPDQRKRLARVRSAIETVTDPEIPVISIMDLGMIADVRIEEDGIDVDMTPTFAGCPALDLIRREIREAVAAVDKAPVTVHIVYDPPWSTDRITEAGLVKLKAFGLAPPGASCGQRGTPSLEQTACPYCDSTNTDLESIFGPTLCRSIHYCRDCLQSFEHFKTV